MKHDFKFRRPDCSEFFSCADQGLTSKSVEGDSIGETTRTLFVSRGVTIKEPTRPVDGEVQNAVEAEDSLAEQHDS